MNPWTEIACGGCGQRVRFDSDTLVADPHRRFLSILPARQCPLAGRMIDPSRLPAWHPKHVCGSYCNGVDASGQRLMFTDCRDKRMSGPPGAVDALADLAEG